MNPIKSPSPLYYPSAILLALLWLLSVGAQAVELTANTNRTIINETESVRLVVRFGESVLRGDPDFSLLEKDFDILGPPQRSNQSISFNGNLVAFTEWNLVLAPKRSGRLLIPSFEFQGSYSDAITINVEEASANSNQNQEIFVELETDKAIASVQEQILVKSRIYFSVSLREVASDDLDIENAIVKPVDETSYDMSIRGTAYRVLEKTYAVFPQQSGQLTIPQINWSAAILTNRSTWFNDPMRRTQDVTRRFRTRPKTLSIKPQPANYTGDIWLPASNLNFEQHWSSDPSRFVVGEPITRTITLTAQGLTSAQLPPLPDQAVDGIKVYSDQPQFDERLSNQGITGQRIESVAILPTRPGTISLPAMTLTWWDTREQKQKSTQLPGQTLEVAPAPYDSSAPPLPDAPPLPTASSENEPGDELQVIYLSPWPWVMSTIALGIVCAWLGSKYWLFRRRVLKAIQPEPNHDPKLDTTWQELRKACGYNNANVARQALCAWGQLFWQQTAPVSLQFIAQHCDHETLIKELKRLDKTLYGSTIEKPWNGELLWRALVDFKRQQQRQPYHQNALAPLYPTS